MRPTGRQARTGNRSQAPVHFGIARWRAQLQIDSDDRVFVYAACLSAALALVYCVAKIDMAIAGDVGMPGIPLADPEASRDLGLVRLRQLGNAAVGLGAAVLALTALLAIASLRARVVVAVALWIGFVFIAAGAGGILLRTAGLLDSLGDIPLTLASGITNAVGVSLTVSWLLMTARYSVRIYQQR